VAANGALRKELSEAGEAKGLTVYHPSPALCTDNAAMVGCAAYFNYAREGDNRTRFDDFMELDAVANLKVGDHQQ
jgi:N6-L-threonylcarbamoyladenine synthase